ncbi:hypothetical protein AAG570_005273 [Ranatra chinensis]|uniref:Uncharacterized protein n=1 Tax=Ranatra chinensis TaxID=642074 RepID=A0ABD0YET5_9HEMI
MASKRPNMFYQNKKQETTEIGTTWSNPEEGLIMTYLINYLRSVGLSAEGEKERKQTIERGTSPDGGSEDGQTGNGDSSGTPRTSNNSEIEDSVVEQGVHERNSSLPGVGTSSGKTPPVDHPEEKDKRSVQGNRRLRKTRWPVASSEVNRRERQRNIDLENEDELRARDTYVPCIHSSGPNWGVSVYDRHAKGPGFDSLREHVSALEALKQSLKAEDGVRAPKRILQEQEAEDDGNSYAQFAILLCRPSDFSSLRCIVLGIPYL